ncbi:MAG: ORF6N domain-containing protein [Pseudomonadota bacterium]
MPSGSHPSIRTEAVVRNILVIRGHKVMLDSELAALYQVQTRVLNQAVLRNIDRFPADFMFQLSDSEFKIWKSQIVTSKSAAIMGLRKRPYAFTEHGVAMLSSVLRSKRAISVNIEIMRAFSRLREVLSTHKDLARQLAALESKYDRQFKVVFDAIRELMIEPAAKTRPIGFTAYLGE